MRVPTILLALFAVVVLSFAFGCSGEKQEQTEVAQPKKPSVAKSLGNPEGDLAKRAAQALILRYKTRLRSELMSAMSQSGAVGAIEICSKRASQIDRDLAVGGWSIRRTAILNRNTANYPTGAEAKVLQLFADDSTKSSFATWDFTNKVKTYRYFEPIRMDEMCSACHGLPEQMDSAVVVKLHELYPGDRAVGFRPGQLRGAFSVSAIWPEGKMEAARLIGSPPL